MAKAARNRIRTILVITHDVASLTSSVMRSHVQLAAENLFLRKQLAFYQERQAKPRRADDATWSSLPASRASSSGIIYWSLYGVAVHAVATTASESGQTSV
jgi:hypothetical protein